MDKFQSPEDEAVKSDSLTLVQLPKISAIYYGLFRSGYDFSHLGRVPGHTDLLREHIGEVRSSAFFAGARQDTCEVYPYWPRAFILEAASFFLSEDLTGFSGFDALRSRIMSAGNITEEERGPSLWKWISGFPEALAEILRDVSFAKYLAWEQEWINGQNDAHRPELELIWRCLDHCVTRWQSPVREIQVCINPVKCVYSSDYHLSGPAFIFTSGEFRADSVIHEFLHHVVHPAVEQQKERILERRPVDPRLDASYYLSGDDAGILNGFEETAVRSLTEKVMNSDYPRDLPSYLKSILE
jgi:hypothetical protein